MAPVKVEVGFISIVPFIVGALMLLAGPVVFGGFAAFLYLDGSEVPPESAIVGIVECTPSVDVPVGAQACAAHVQVSGIRSSGKVRVVTLSNTFVGERGLKVGGSDFTLPSHGRQRWIACKAESQRFATLDKVVGIPPVKRQFPQYAVTVWAFRGGEPVIVDVGSGGKARRIWCGTHESISANAQAYRNDIVMIFGPIGLGVTLVGALMLGIGAVARRRTVAARPNEDAPLAEWGAWTVRQRSAKCAGEYRGFPVTIQRLYRRRTEGPVRLELQCDMSHDVTWIRRSGAVGIAGQVVDGLAGLAVHDGEELGYPDFEVAFSDPEARAWLQREDVHSAVEQIAQHDAGANIVSLAVRPKRLILTLASPSSAVADQRVVERWLDSLARLAGASR